MQIQGFSGQLNYVDCRPNESEPGKTFCDKHTMQGSTKGMSLHICWIASLIYLRPSYTNYFTGTSHVLKVTEGGTTLMSIADCQG